MKTLLRGKDPGLAELDRPLGKVTEGFIARSGACEITHCGFSTVLLSHLESLLLFYLLHVNSLSVY